MTTKDNMDSLSKPSPIRVLHVLGNLNRGGAESYLMNIYRKIDRSKVQFDFIIHTNEKCDFSDEIVELGGKIYSVPRFSVKSSIRYIKEWSKFFRNNSEYKIIHSHIRSTAAIILLIAKKYGLVTISHSHSISSGSGFVSVIKNGLQYFIRYIADYRIACSQNAGKWLFGNKPFNIMKNAIDVNNFYYDREIREETRKSLGLDNDIVIGHVGSFTFPKNHIFLLDIFNEIANQNASVKLLLVGDGPLKDDIIHHAKKLKIINKIIFTGVRSDIPDLLNAIDLIVFPSRYEGFPVTMIEAQATGVSCLISKAITDEVQITDLVHYMSLENSPKEWANKSIELIKPCNRYSYSNEIIKAGYDSIYQSDVLTQFYLKIQGEFK
ncbi:MAG: glycosyltransferase [Sedimentibacter sp.]|uniref:glycosyltransferase n=1 Tax=Sedimentibacter sp. TaxID=1960295 RepID=UPI002982AB0C|nr:glycosyltransferase [Sedimentibacter sp.]MDW5298974.1 glycosyltransferase [Sedimentibacter sp.]